MSDKDLGLTGVAQEKYGEKYYEHILELRQIR
ncbi:hypothetical protein BH20ACI4_BH20ACI4_17810 [soil metagenome]